MVKNKLVVRKIGLLMPKLDYNRLDMFNFNQKTILFLLISFMAVLVSSTTVYANSYYVDSVNGSDGNAGSAAAPWKSINFAIANVNYGDTIMLNDGDYGQFISQGQSTGSMDQALPANTSWLTIKSVHPLKAIFSAAGNSSAIELGSYHSDRKLAYKFDGIKVKGTVRLLRTLGVKFINGEIIGNSDSIDTAYGSFYMRNACDITIKNTVVHHIRDNGICGSANYLNIIDNDVYDVGSDHILLSSGNNVLIEDNHLHHTIWWSKDDSSPMHPDGIMIWYGPFSNVTIRNNTIHDLAVQGIFVVNFSHSGPLENLTITNNLIYNVHTTALILDEINGATISNNTVLDGMRAGENITNMKVFNNLFASPYYAKSYNIFSYHDYNVYIRGAGGAGYFNAGENEPHSYKYAYGTSPSEMGIFIDANNNNYQILENSKAVNFGVITNAPVIDIDGDFRDSMPDVGCYEFGSDGNEPNDPNTPSEPNVSVTIEAVPAQVVTEGQTVEFDINLTVTGADITQASCQLQNLPIGAMFDGHHFRWTPMAGQAKTYFLKFIATCQDANDTAYVALTVEQQSAYHAPVFDSFAGTTVVEAQKLYLPVSATDPDGDEVQIEAANLPHGAIFYNNSLIWVPGYGDAGTYQIELSASDSENITFQTVNIVVNAAETQTYPGRRLIYYWYTTRSLLGDI